MAHQVYTIGREFGSMGLLVGQKLAERLGITPDEIAVFGDGENDLSMFRVVKYPIAMGNAMDTVKKEAFEVTLDNNSSGIAHFLKKHNFQKHLSNFQTLHQN